MNRSGKSRLCDFVESTVEDANITRLPSINSKKGEGVEPGEQAAPHERDLEEQLERDRRAHHLLDVGADDGKKGIQK